MSVFCKGCRKTKVNEGFGLKDNGTQYKTCIQCRNKKIKKIEEKEETIIECCDVELIRDTFRQLNCEIVYLNDLRYMFNLDRNITNEIFIEMMSTRNFDIAETITSDKFCFILNLLEHIGFHTNDIRTYDINIIVHKTSKDKMLRTISDSHMNIYHGFMECLKLPNKNMCDICNCKKKCFRQCVKCENELCVECFKNHNK